MKLGSGVCAARLGTSSTDDGIADVDDATGSLVAIRDDFRIASFDIRAKVGAAVPTKRIATLESDYLGGEAFTQSAGNASTTNGTRFGGVRTVASNATADHTSDAYVFSPVFGSTAPPGPVGGNTGEVAWGVSYRAAFQGTVDAGTEHYVGIGQVPGQIWLGIHGSTSLTKYVLQVRQGIVAPIVLSSDLDIDTTGLFRQFDLVFDRLANLLWTRVNAGTWRSHSAAGIYNGYGYVCRRLKNGAAATVRYIEHDWYTFSQEGP